MRRVLTGLLAVGSLVALLTGLALAQAKKPDATLTLNEGSVAVGIGIPGVKGRSVTRERPIRSRSKGSRLERWGSSARPRRGMCPI